MLYIQWTLVTDDLEELLKTDATQTTDSLNDEVKSKWTSACDVAQKAEDDASEMSSLLTQVGCLYVIYLCRLFNKKSLTVIKLIEIQSLDESNAIVRKVLLKLQEDTCGFKNCIIKVKVEHHEIYDTFLCLQTKDDASLKTVEVTQTMKKILTEMRERKEALTQLFDNWTMHASQHQSFKSQWDSFIQESRKVGIWKFCDCDLFYLFERM